MLKRRLSDTGLSSIYSNHSFRAAGITNYLKNGGTLETAQRIAGHADSRTTKLYDRRGQKLLLEDMERIRYYFTFVSAVHFPPLVISTCLTVIAHS
jgi:integrase/recombinase XerD